jgi:hypothetical protein
LGFKKLCSDWDLNPIILMFLIACPHQLSATVQPSIKLIRRGHWRRFYLILIRRTTTNTKKQRRYKNVDEHVSSNAIKEVHQVGFEPTMGVTRRLRRPMPYPLGDWCKKRPFKRRPRTYEFNLCC